MCWTPMQRVRNCSDDGEEIDRREPILFIQRRQGAENLISKSVRGTELNQHMINVNHAFRESNESYLMIILSVKVLR